MKPYRVWLVDFDGKMENLALMRLSSWLRGEGASVSLKRGEAYPELWDTPDQVYVSCLFRWNETRVRRYVASWNGRAIAGGTGFDLAVRLPSEVMACQPDYGLYGGTRAIGFISRGCIRKCPWCLVPEKEGKLRRVSTAAEIVGDRKEAIFLDNNFLALPDHDHDLRWLAKRGIPIDFNQGLDARLVTPDNAAWMAKCKWIPQGPRFALDSLGQVKSVRKALDIMREAGIIESRIRLYILLGFSGLDSDVRRLKFAGEWRTGIFPMGFRDLLTGEEPARGWDRRLYNKYRRLLIRTSRSKGVWQDFEREVVQGLWRFRDEPLFDNMVGR